MALGIGSGLHSGCIVEEENRWMKRVFGSTQTSYSIPLWLTDFGASRSFNKFRQNKDSKIQVLEILGDGEKINIIDKLN